MGKSRKPNLGMCGIYTEKFHIPADLVVDQWASDGESSLSLEVLLLPNLETRFVA
jgi:hypothetical protein